MRDVSSFHYAGSCRLAESSRRTSAPTRSRRGCSQALAVWAICLADERRDSRRPRAQEHSDRFHSRRQQQKARLRLLESLLSAGPLATSLNAARETGTDRALHPGTSRVRPSPGTGGRGASPAGAALPGPPAMGLDCIDPAPRPGALWVRWLPEFRRELRMASRRQRPLPTGNLAGQHLASR